jgi:hypothetical protein
MDSREKVSIACSSGFWGDTPQSVAQILSEKDLDFIVSDYLSEVTLSILARIKKREPGKGYIQDFFSDVIEPHLENILARKIRLVTNAGALNPHGLKKLIEEFAGSRGISVKVIAVTGDDLKEQNLLAETITDMEGKEWKTKSFITANAYLGVLPIVEALNEGADIVVTGRIVDTALISGPAIHSLKKDFSDFDFLASASLAGHIIECGTQCTGGNFTDWQSVPERQNVGFPVIRISSDNSFIVTKPPGTGGLVTPATIAEQVVYEIGDPENYLLPDVICDFRSVTLKELGPDSVLVLGAKGRAPTPFYKVSATVMTDYKLHATAFIKGGDAKAKARDIGETILKKVKHILPLRNLPPFSQTKIETLGGSDEILLRISAVHTDQSALEILSKEIAPGATGLAPGMTNLLGGRASPIPRIRLVSFLFPKTNLKIPVTVVTDGAVVETAKRKVIPASMKTKKIRLGEIARARSGDKGNDVNIGVMARDPKDFEAMKCALTDEVVKKFFFDEFDHSSAKQVKTWDLPGIHALNFLIKDCLGGGGASSLSIDPQGKAWAQRLLQIEIEIPENV